MVGKQEMSEAARRAKNDYARMWRRKNPDKAKAIQDRYWEKKARKIEAELKERRDKDARE